MEQLAYGFSVAFQLDNLFYCFLGVLLGTLMGVLPGIGSVAAVAMLMPLAFYLEPTAAIIMLAGVYYGAEYGGSTASILLNLPGTPSSAVTCLDGYPMARKGRAGVALFMTTIASFVGGTSGIVILLFLTPAAIAFAIAFGPAEYFAAMVLGLIAVATIARGSPLKGLMMVVVGLIIGTIGVDINSGAIRYNFGILDLYDGVTIVVLAMGLFGVSEVISSIGSADTKGPSEKVTLRSMVPTREDVKASVLPIIRGSGVGSATGPIPGVGPLVASFMSYALEKRVARDPSRFGKGAIEGIAGPESANNAAAQTAFIPTLAMGIPGSATMAVLLGALMMHGITPGPRLVTDHAELFWGVVASFWIGNVILLILNIPLIGIWVSLLRIPYVLLYPIIVCLICVGVYSVNNSLFDVWLVLGIGLLGYVLKILDFEPAPLLMGFVLGPLLEENFRRGMLLNFGDFSAFFQRPISGTLLVVATTLLVAMIGSAIWRARTARSGAPAE